MDDMLNQDDRIQKALNDVRRQRIIEKYGAIFSGDDGAVPPELEADWLLHIEEFEQQYENARQTTVREYCGNPSFPPFESVPPGGFSDEMDRVVDFFAGHNIFIHTVADASDEELYRFATTEFLDQEIDDIRVEGLTSHYIYEEYHPNEEFAAKCTGEGFVETLFRRDERFLPLCLSHESITVDSGIPKPREEALDLIWAFYRRYPLFTGNTIGVIETRLEGDAATVRLNITWSGLEAPEMKPAAFQGEGIICLKRREPGCYEVIGFTIPGLMPDTTR
jgi:hypothetical protein